MFLGYYHYNFVSNNMARGDKFFGGFIRSKKRSKSLDRKPRRSKTVSVRFDLPDKKTVEISGPTQFRRVRSFSECPGLEGYWSSDSEEPMSPTEPKPPVRAESNIVYFITLLYRPILCVIFCSSILQCLYQFQDNFVFLLSNSCFIVSACVEVLWFG